MLRPRCTLWLLLSCGSAACAPVRPSAPAPAVAAPALGTDAWTSGAGVRLRADSDTVVLPYGAMRLQVLGRDSAGVRVRCLVCPGYPTGWVEPGELLIRAATLEEAARRPEAAEFALALREAALRRDVAALASVMSPEFVTTPGGLEGAASALAAWRAQGFRPLDELARAIDRGVVPLPHGGIWAAPPEWVARTGYPGAHAGFRRENGRWVWLFLLPGR